MGQLKIQELESVHRITNLPIVESGWNIAENVYNKIKNSNTLFQWTFDQTESTLQTAIDIALPTLNLFQTPISSIDKILCKSLDIVEDKLPAIGLPPEMIYWNTKQYVTEQVGIKIVRPVLKRADSVKQIGNTVLTSKYTTYAADTLDGALDIADKYVEKYLPDDDQNEPEVNNKVDGENRAIQTIHHMGRFSGKLQRRLTRRTLAEAKALKEQSTEAIHVLIYVAELVATDPKLAYSKGKELWEMLSEDEPENQARPENLEQLVVLLTRESARRVVHLINYTGGVISKVPKTVSIRVLNGLTSLLLFIDSLVKSVHLDGIQAVLVSSFQYQTQHLTVLLKEINNYISMILDNVSESLSTTSSESSKSALEVPKIQVQLRAAMKKFNGVDSNAN